MATFTVDSTLDAGDDTPVTRSATTGRGTARCGATTNGTGGGSQGGGVFDNSGELTIQRSSVTENESTATSGAPAGEGGVHSAGTGLIEDPTIANNESSDGGDGGLIHTGAPAVHNLLIVRRSTITGNQRRRHRGVQRSRA